MIEMPLLFLGKFKTIFVSIFVGLAASTVTALGENIMKIVLFKCCGFFTLWLYFVKITSIFFIFQMKCLLCNATFLSEVDLKNRYFRKHSINENNIYLNDLFRPDTIYKGCDICDMDFENSRSKKNNMLLFHYGQTGVNRGNWQLLINI